MLRKNSETDEKEFSFGKISLNALKRAFPIPGSHTLEKVGETKVDDFNKMEEGENGDLILLPHKKEKISVLYNEEYHARKAFDEAFNNDPFNIIFRTRNLISKIQPITWELRLENLGRHIIGWHEDDAPNVQKGINKPVALVVFPAKPIRVAVEILKRVIRLPVDIVKLPLVVLPDMLADAAYAGIFAARNQVKEALNRIERRQKTITFGKTISQMNLHHFGKYLAEYTKIAIFGLLTGASAVAWFVLRAWHFVANAALAPRENVRRYFNEWWNKISEQDQKTFSGKLLNGLCKTIAIAVSALSIITTVAAYTLAAFFAAPLAMGALSGIATATAGTAFGTFINSVIAGISYVATALSTVVGPVGAWLTATVETLATSLPFLSTVAAAVGNVIPTTLGLFALGGAAVAITGTASTMIAGAANDKYHSYALINSLKEPDDFTGDPTQRVVKRRLSNTDDEEKLLNDSDESPRNSPQTHYRSSSSSSSFSKRSQHHTEVVPRRNSDGDHENKNPVTSNPFTQYGSTPAPSSADVTPKVTPLNSPAPSDFEKEASENGSQRSSKSGSSSPSDEKRSSPRHLRSHSVLASSSKAEEPKKDEAGAKNLLRRSSSSSSIH